MKDKFLSKITECNIQKYLFIGSLLICLIIGISLSYNFNFTRNYNLLFESDSSRIINDITEYGKVHPRTHAHPLFVMLLEPIYYLVKAIFINKMLSLVVISSLVTSLTVLFIYKILSLYGKTKSLKLLVSLCYLFSFSNYIFTAGIEAYNIATLFLVLLWYYVLKKYPEKKPTTSKYFVLTALGVSTFAITITNYAIFLIILFFLLAFKKINIRKAIVVAFASIGIAIGLSFVQNLLWHNTRFINTNSLDEEKHYSNFNINVNKIVNVIKNDYYYAIIGNNTHVESNNHERYRGDNYVITFNSHNNIFPLVVVATFYFLLIILAVRNYQKNLFANLCITSSILFNTVLHIFYGNELPFLYSMHFLYLFYLGFGINMMQEKNKVLISIAKYYLIILFIIQLVFNNYFFVKIVKIVKTILPCNYYVANFDVLPATIFMICIIMIIGFIIYAIYYFYCEYKLCKTSDDKIKCGITIAALIIVMQSVFISLEANEANNMFIFKKINDKPRSIYIDTDKYLEQDTTN